jgi:hypothetical protein
MNPSQTAIMSLEESRPRGTVLDERADRCRVCEVEFFSMQGVQRLEMRVRPQAVPFEQPKPPCQVERIEFD